MGEKRAGMVGHVVAGALFATVMIADQLTKSAAVAFFAERGVTLPAPRWVESAPVMGGLFGLRLQENTGGAFGMFGNASTVPTFLLATSALAMVFIGWYYWMYRDSAWMRFAMAFIAGGAVGNLIDRVRLGYVVDFIDVDIGSYQWPYFNLADSFICIGAGMLIIHLVRDRRFRQRGDEANEAA